ncbi:MAG: glycosyltransferase [candidate division KSB1 bacterium]|nr:glycosyltransferase [candidate division KSB1 bacterium]
MEVPRRVLMLAPEPVFTPRGTPFSVVGRLKAYSDEGVRVDLVTYHLGQDVALPGVRFHRIWALPGVRRVKVGPSWIKPVLDALLLARTLSVWRPFRYDLVHTHEEAGLVGAFLREFTGCAHVYDMHSSLAQQMTNFRFSSSRWAIRTMESLERFILSHCDSVLVICEDLRRYVQALGFGHKLYLLENTLDYSFLWDEGTPGSLTLDSALPRPWVVYVGTLEPYQGMELLLSSVRILRDRSAWVGSLLIAGGHTDQVEAYRGLAQELGLDGLVHFLGTVHPGAADHLVRAADVLVSPRVSGTNTPLKIYSYLRSGKPIVATDIWSHTQVLSPDVCALVAPEPEAFAAALSRLLHDEGLRRDLGERAKRYAATRFSDQRYRQTLLAAATEAIARRKTTCAA